MKQVSNFFGIIPFLFVVALNLTDSVIGLDSRSYVSVSFTDIQLSAGSTQACE